jgi:tartrate-resistant acid phosphatase type 5
VRINLVGVFPCLFALASCAMHLDARNAGEETGPELHPDAGATGGAEPDTDPEPDPDDPNDDTVPDTDGSTGADTAGGSAPTASAPPIRFIALGDGGRGNSEQYEVAAAIEAVCAAQGCDFAIHMGDNIYDEGVEDVDDEQFQEKFELPYANLSFPFYMVLGNHDWGSGETGVDAQVAYTARSSKWMMPARYYSFQQGDATFFGLDTDPISDGNDDGQASWLTTELPAATTTWKFAFGHHPYISNGDHGDGSGELRDFVDANLCGNIDVYFAGHDHDLQWLEPSCGIEHIVSGAGSSLRDLGGSNPTRFETATLGFMWVELQGTTFTGVFYDSDGTELYRHVLLKSSGSTSAPDLGTQVEPSR